MSIQKLKIVSIYSGGQGEIVQVQKYPKTKKISMKNSNFEKIFTIYIGEILIKKSAKLHESAINRNGVVCGTTFIYRDAQGEICLSP